jgi:hypothetical protein
LDYNIEGADCGRFPVKPGKPGPNGKMPTENQRTRACRVAEVELNLLWRWVRDIRVLYNMVVVIFSPSSIKIKDMKKNKASHLRSS